MFGTVKFLSGSIAIALFTVAAAIEPCRIEVIEQDSGWPVPLVEFKTTNDVRFVTDNAGVIAFDLPEAMGRETWFHVSGHGYSVKADIFGYRGVKLTPKPGQTLKVEVERTILAKRIGRITGSGLFGESQKCDPSLVVHETGIHGCDSVQNAIHNGKLYWFWGDTNVPRYPLGIFDASGATTAVNPLTALKPPLRLPLDLFRDYAGLPRGVAKLAGTGPTWLTGVVSLPDRNGTAHLVTAYMKIKPPLDIYQWGQAEWNAERQEFATLSTVWTKSDDTPKPPSVPEGHAVQWTDADGKRWALFGDPFPTLKCPATFEAWQDRSQWTPVVPQVKLVDVVSGDAVKAHRGAIAWNEFRKRWVTIYTQQNGKPSLLGEIWYAEASSPLGPWEKTIKVLSHDNYTFYNPQLHPEFSAADPRVLYFEGTYTTTFTKNVEPTPRYEYNQILYRLDLDDLQLKAAQAP